MWKHKFLRKKGQVLSKGSWPKETVRVCRKWPKALNYIWHLFKSFFLCFNLIYLEFGLQCLDEAVPYGTKSSHFFFSITLLADCTAVDTWVHASSSCICKVLSPCLSSFSAITNQDPQVLSTLAHLFSLRVFCFGGILIKLKSIREREPEHLECVILRVELKTSCLRVQCFFFKN